MFRLRTQKHIRGNSKIVLCTSQLPDGSLESCLFIDDDYSNVETVHTTISEATAGHYALARKFGLL